MRAIRETSHTQGSGYRTHWGRSEGERRAQTCLQASEPSTGGGKHQTHNRVLPSNTKNEFLFFKIIIKFITTNMCPEFKYSSKFDGVYDSDDEYTVEEDPLFNTDDVYDSDDECTCTVEEDPFFNISADVLDSVIRNSCLFYLVVFLFYLMSLMYIFDFY
jgi:hypothetical protein